MNLQTQKPKWEKGKKVEVKAEHFKVTRTNIVEKGNKAMTTTTERASPKLVLGANNFKGPTFEEKKKKVYPFQRDKVKKSLSCPKERPSTTKT